MSRTYTIEKAKPTFGRVIFPKSYKLAIYVRQSKGEQVENNPESFLMQTTGLLAIARGDLEWPEENILEPFVENEQASNGRWKDASGTLRLDQRPALQKLVARIISGEVKAILVVLVDRLFRDEDGAEAPAFARICKEHKCLVLTSQGEIFDFTNQRDYKRFLREADAASEFITDYLRGRAHPARKQVALRGEYDGRAVPVGFHVEQKVAKKRFEKSTPRHYLVYEPHAATVRWIFRRYRELAGDFVALKREIAQKVAEQEYLFAFFPSGMHIPHIHLRRNEYGYIISDRGLKDLLCNIAYVGWWYNKGAAPIQDNHPALVDETDFWYAFDRLSPVTIDGKPQERKRAHYTKVGTVPVPALLKDVLIAESPYKVYVNQNAYNDRSAAYAIIHNTEYYGGDKVGSIAVSTLDSIFTTHLLAKLQAGKELRDFWKQMGETSEWLPSGLAFHLTFHLQDIAKMQQVSTAGIDAQIKEYREKATNLDKTLQFGAAKLSPKKIEEYSEKLTKYERSIDQLETKKRQAEKRIADLATFIERLDDIPAVWHKLGTDEQRRFVELATKKVTLTKVAPHWLQLAIAWWEAEEDYQDVCYIWQRKAGESWTDEENDILRQYYSCVDRATLLELLSDRSWTAIQRQAFQLQLSRPYIVRSNNTTLHASLSVEDMQFMQQVGIEFNPENAKQQAWWFSIQISEDSLC